MISKTETNKLCPLRALVLTLPMPGQAVLTATGAIADNSLPVGRAGCSDRECDHLVTSPVG